MGAEEKEKKERKAKPPPPRYRVHYTGRLEDGSVFDTSRDKEPITVPLGQNRVIPGFEAVLKDMQAGETRKVTIPPSKGYGAYREELVSEVPREKFSPDLELKEGQYLQLTNRMGMVSKVRVKALEENRVILDANHPLAGKKLVFEIEVIEIF